VRIGILGPLEVRDTDGRSLPVGGARLRSLLIRLAIAGGDAVPVDRLAADLWPGEGPADAANAVQALVSRLRGAAGKDIVSLGPTGYRLTIPSGEIDAWAFEQAVTAAQDLRAACTEIEAAVGAPFADGYASEVCLRLSPWLASVSDCLECGLVLLSDYGLPRRHYYHPQRMAGTLRCHFRQRAHDDPYINLGVQDITAWVDFTRVAEAALDAGLTVSGFATQAAFLVGLGLEALVAEAAGPVERVRLAGEARRLVMPEEMGEAFKMMALTRALEVPLAGFALQDLRHQL